MKRVRAEPLPPWTAGGGAAAGRTVLGSAGWAVGAGLVRGGGSLAAMLVLARLTAPEQFGVIGMILPVLFFLGMLSDLGTGLHTLQRARLAPDELGQCFWIGMAGGIAAGLLFALAAPLLARLYGEPQVLAPALALALWFPLQALRLQHDALARRCLRHDLAARAELAETAGALAVGVSLGLAGAGLWALVGLVLARPAVHAAAIWALTGWRPGPPRLCGGMWRLAGSGGRLLAADGALFAARALDRVVIGLAGGAAALGPYHLAHQMVTTPLQQVQTPLAGVAIPALTRLRGDPDAFARMIARTGGGLAHALWPALAIAAVAREPLVRLVLGEAWSAAAPLVGLLALAGIGMAVRLVPGWALVALGRPERALRWNLAAALPVGLGVLAGLAAGPAGVAAGVAAAELGLVPLALLRLRREGVAAGPLLAALVPPAALAAAAAAAAAGLIAFAAPAGDAGALALAGLAWAVAMAGSAALLGAGGWRGAGPRPVREGGRLA